MSQLEAPGLGGLVVEGLRELGLEPEKDLGSCEFSVEEEDQEM